MNIIWSDLAVGAFWAIRDSIFSKFGIEKENEFVEATDVAIKQVVKFPKSGIEELELAADGSVRSILVRKLSKIIYYIDGDTLHVADVWDIRQDPDALNTRVAAIL